MYRKIENCTQFLTCHYCITKGTADIEKIHSNWSTQSGVQIVIETVDYVGTLRHAD